MLGLFIGLLYRYRLAQTMQRGQDSNSSLTGDSGRLGRAIKTLRIAVIVLPLLLVSGLWATRRQPLLPRLVGAGINLLITAYLVSLLRRAKSTGSA